MTSQSQLMMISNSIASMPVYFTRAAKTSDPVERMKLVIAGSFCWVHYFHDFVKPLNPILGETYQCIGRDGTKVFMEQSSHHPPRSHFLIEGPDGLFKLSGHLAMAIFAGLQSSTANSQGHKLLEFSDGGKIKFN